MSASLNAKIAQVFDEPGCDVNQAKGEKERKKGCTKQLTPGAAAGGCAFDGAKIALQPIVVVAYVPFGRGSLCTASLPQPDSPSSRCSRSKASFISLTA